MGNLTPVRFSANLQPAYHGAMGDLSAATLGGKGAGLIAMTKIGLNVPQGFIFGVNWCHEYQKSPEGTMKAVKTRLSAELEWLRLESGLSSNGQYDTPLMSVRSGAPVSMPGMMDTILNVGLTSTTAEFWAYKLGSRTASDCYRRLIQMMGVTAYDIPHEKFEKVLNAVRLEAGVITDKDLSAHYMGVVSVEFLELFEKHIGHKFPDTVEEQVLVSIETVFKSWNSERAKVYRKLHGISDDLGTAVTVQRMVFGNLGPTSGTGVMFTRNPNTGEKGSLIEYLDNAQGEDVVAGIRTPYTPKDPQLLAELDKIAALLENHYRDMVDLEFTVEEGKLFILQSRNGKRQARAALKIALDLIEEKLVDKAVLSRRIKREHIRQLLRPTLDPSFKEPPVATGIDASGGFAQGEVVFTSEAAINCKAEGKPCILVRLETSPDDIAGMAAADGVLTAQGGSTSHAAVVARGMNKPCVTGCQELTFGSDAVQLAGKTIIPGLKIAIDGDTGRVWRDVDLPVVEPDKASLLHLAKMVSPEMAKLGLLHDAADKESVISATEAGALEKAQSEEQLYCFDMRSSIEHYSTTDREFADLCGTLDTQMAKDVKLGGAILKELKNRPHMTVQPTGLSGIGSLIGANKKVNVGQYLFGQHDDPVYLSEESLQEIGGREALHRIGVALKRELPHLIEAVPLEYALFSVLHD